MVSENTRETEHKQVEANTFCGLLNENRWSGNPRGASDSGSSLLSSRLFSGN